ncbi:hypothetical protein HDA40_000301 [Hamadaea flava]|uniref:Uncharacterized protein n=1 Tax=Hamadaea flava TaxID=1742688 RepID=A0ABV8LT58_9ACTN|nr:hypothetical protein [Hamadaea flava]MCP2321794.1 hypothetical protein [Hamadaea flava]
MRRALLTVVLFAAGCTATPASAPTAVSSASSAGMIGPAAACPASAAAEPLVRQAYGQGVEMWVMLFPTQPTLVAGQTLKIVVRLTGGRQVTVTADGPGQRRITPEWGPEWHGDSTFDKPGGEFGVGLDFPAAGCWTVRVVNESGSGELTLRIGDRPSASPS